MTKPYYQKLCHDFHDIPPKNDFINHNKNKLLINALTSWKEVCEQFYVCALL